MTESLWRNRDYLLYRGGRTISMLGSRMTALAGPLLVLHMGGGAVWAGATGSCWFIAQMTMQLPAGYLSDRFDRRRLMLAMDAVRFVAIGSIPLAALFGFLTLPQLLVVVAVEGGASVVFSSAAMVFLRALAPGDQFPKAMSQSQFSMGATTVLGPILGGALFAVDRFLPFLVDVGSYVVSAAFLLAMSARAEWSPTGARRSGNDGDGGEDNRLTAGLRWLWHRPPVLRIVLFCMVLNLVGSASGVAALVVMTQHRISTGAIGVVMACSGYGVIAGSLIATRAVKLGRWLFPLIGLLWAGSLAAVAVSASPWVVGAVLTLLAVLGPSTGVAMFKMLRDESPSEMYGRVLAGQQLIGTRLATAGPMTAGLLIAALGGRYLWLLFAGTCLLATALTVGPLSSARRSAADETPAPEQPAPAAQGA